jgi:hypothetical protein
MMVGAVPAGFLKKLEYYAVGTETLLGPQSWSCSQPAATNGSSSMAVFPPGSADPTKEQVSGALLRWKDDVQVLETPGTLMGPFSDWHGQVVERELAEGDLLLLYSDGLVEARRGPHQFGLDRLMDVVRSTAGLDPASTVEVVVETAARFSTGGDDDVTVLGYQVRCA